MATPPLARRAYSFERTPTAQTSELLLAQAAGALESGEPALIEGPLRPRVDDLLIVRLCRRSPARALRAPSTQAPRARAGTDDIEHILRRDSRPLDVVSLIRISTTVLDDIDVDALERRIRAWIAAGDVRPTN
ncbi:MAG: hypothetical protein EXR66_00125 [Dehalococcoidia bacterium]|nr:hypothetical protein [Dehalococcoidia bacterium]